MSRFIRLVFHRTVNLSPRAVLTGGFTFGARTVASWFIHGKEPGEFSKFVGIPGETKWGRVPLMVQSACSTCADRSNFSPSGENSVP